MEILWLILLSSVVVAASIIGTMVGFGLSTILMPLFIWVMPFEHALLLSALIHGFHSLTKVICFRQSIHWNTVLWFGAPAVTAVIGAAHFLETVSSLILQLSFCAILIIQALFIIRGSATTVTRSPLTSFFAGAFTGVCATLFGIQGPIRMQYFIAARYSIAETIATTAAIALLIDTVRLLFYVHDVHIVSEMIPVGVGGLGASVLGVLIGRRVLARVSYTTFRVLVAGGLIIVATLYAAKVVSRNDHTKERQYHREKKML